MVLILILRFEDKKWAYNYPWSPCRNHLSHACRSYAISRKRPPQTPWKGLLVRRQSSQLLWTVCRWTAASQGLSGASFASRRDPYSPVRPDAVWECCGRTRLRRVFVETFWVFRPSKWSWCLHHRSPFHQLKSERTIKTILHIIIEFACARGSILMNQTGPMWSRTPAILHQKMPEAQLRWWSRWLGLVDIVVSWTGDADTF